MAMTYVGIDVSKATFVVAYSSAKSSEIRSAGYALSLAPDMPVRSAGYAHPPLGVPQRRICPVLR